MPLTGNVLITGGTGFLGRGIMRKAEREGWIAKFTVYSRDEYKQDLCRQRFPNARYVLGDVTNKTRLLHAFQGQDTIIHAAAIKYIPEAEFNVAECIDVNVNGSLNVLEAACTAGVGAVVAISTDKAVAPINVYGMTKALMERLIGEYARQQPSVDFFAVRYGNVIGSTGSVIPLFQRQLKETGRITITDPDMTRYWISVDAAVKLIELPFEGAVQSGSVIIPKPAALTLMELAKIIAGDAPIDIVGVRPGERRHEQLLHLHESVRAIDCSLFFELLPVWAQPVNDKPFILSSNTPEVYAHPSRFSDLVADAAFV